ncbi:MAG: formate dehydrogenase accessory sulfurtransferase FdhD [Alphaproteobacteria bacterium]|nr:formate dehydrogenase accessory sulfurtransferase FdhD [Alphaproteobacteria bacterium]
MIKTRIERPSQPPAHGPEQPAPTLASTDVERWADGRLEACQDWVAEEVPVSLDYNGLSHAVMLASPADLEDFAIGFSLTEGLVDHVRDITDIAIDTLERGIRIRLDITGRCFARLKERRRSLAGRTGCGLCGTDSLDQVFRDIQPVAADTCFQPDRLAVALNRLAARQSLQGMTGAAHAAGWIDALGQLHHVREDVGRHNALDKLIGALAQAGQDAGQGAMLVTSRASYEMVQKAAASGCGMLVAVSAPTALAIRTAHDLNVTLVGFARQGRHTVYSHAWRLAADGDARLPAERGEIR